MLIPNSSDSFLAAYFVSASVSTQQGLVKDISVFWEKMQYSCATICPQVRWFSLFQIHFVRVFPKEIKLETNGDGVCGLFSCNHH